MKNLNLNPIERDVIAEFVYSKSIDVLIKHDGIKLINVLEHHHIITKDEKTSLRNDIDNQKDGVAEELENLLSENIPTKQVVAIMDEYFGTHKYEL